MAKRPAQPHFGRFAPDTLYGALKSIPIWAVTGEN